MDGGKLNPRFKRIPKKTTKVKVGSRFSKMFTDKAFQDETDDLEITKYGLPVRSKKSKHLSKVYELEKEEEESSSSEVNTQQQQQPSSDEEEGEEQVTTLRDSSSDGENDGDNYEGAYSDDDNEEGGFHWSAESSSEEEEVIQEEEEESKEEIEDGDETRRIAILNLDWDHIKAEDIFGILHSFLPTSANPGSISRVSVVPSLFGLERMDKEQAEGPAGDIWRENDSEEESQPISKHQKKKDKLAFDPNKLRKYQLERLKYYYAIVECNSAETALHLYRSCDGTEIEQTGNTFDMRFIPDDVELDERQIVRDEATSPPVVSKLPEFHTKALQHSNVKLTWDQDDPDRVRLTKSLRDESIFTDNAYLPLEKERQLHSILANSSDDESSSDDSDNDEPTHVETAGDSDASIPTPVDTKSSRRKQVRKKYSSLLEMIHGDQVNLSESFGRSSRSGAVDDDDVDMEITFTPGISDSVKDLVDRSLAKKSSEEKSSWDLHLERLAEKKKAKKLARRNEVLQKIQKESEEKELRKKARKKNKKNKRDEPVDPELELLLADTKKKNKKSSHVNNDDEPFTIDPRFEQVVSNPADFALERNNPMYNASSKFVSAVHSERQKRKSAPKDDTATSDSSVDVKSIVSKLKKTGNRPFPNTQPRNKMRKLN